MPATTLDPTVPPPVRRQALNRIWLGAALAFLVVLVTGIGIMLWPNGVPTSEIVDVGSIHDIRADHRTLGRPLFVEGHDLFIVPVSHNLWDGHQTDVAHDGLLILSAIDVRDRRVVYCKSSMWFGDPFDGSKYNFIGEVQRGSPSPMGLFRHPFWIENGRLHVDTGKRLPGLTKRQGNTLDQPPAGPHCSQQGEDGIAPG